MVWNEFAQEMQQPFSPPSGYAWPVWDPSRGCYISLPPAGGNVPSGNKKSRETWICCNPACSAQNTTPKSCQSCGLRRSYLNVASSPTSPASVGTNTRAPSTPQKRDAVSSSLSQAASGRDTTTSAPTAAHSGAPASGTAETYDLTSLDPKDSRSKKEVVDDLKSAEAALAALPDTERFHVMRSDLLATIADCKSSLGAFKPLGKRLDAAQEALKRARHRHQEAVDAHVIAVSNV